MFSLLWLPEATRRIQSFSNGSKHMRRRWRNFELAILPTRKSFFHVSWNFIPTLCWPKCILSRRQNTNKCHPTKRGKRSKFFRRNDCRVATVLPSEVEGPRNDR